jgi:VIT1/CCC1 family predicted Fe2+/Mn2+ transporter
MKASDFFTLSVESAWIYQLFTTAAISDVYSETSRRAFSHAAKSEHEAYKMLIQKHDSKIIVNQLKDAGSNLEQNA